MRVVKWTDENGWVHRSQIRDSDPDSAAKKGIPRDPPDVNQIDWEAVKRDLHNLLADRGLINLADVRSKGEHLRSAAQSVLYERLIALYVQSP